MSWLDYAIIGVIVASIAWGVWRGLMREVMSLAGWVLAFLAANAVAGPLGDLLPDSLGSAEVRILVAFAVVFVFTLSAATLVGMLLAKLFKAAGLGGVDRTLAENLAASGFAPETWGVCGMLKDKDIGGVLRELAPRVTRWHLATLPGPRGALADELEARVEKSSVRKFVSPSLAFAAALGSAGENDKIVVFGSFLTVGEVIEWLKRTTSRR